MELAGFSVARTAPEMGGKSIAYSPVYCVDIWNNCENISRRLCERGSCLQDECFIENYCYSLEKRGKELIPLAP